MDEDSCVAFSSQYSMLQQIKEKYADVRKLIDEKSKLDPEDQPYKSKYDAKEILKILLHCIKALPPDEHVTTPEGGDGYQYRRLPLLHSLFYYDLGVISVDTEELSAGEEHLMNSLNILREHGGSGSGASLFLINVLNQLGILWSNRGDYTKACDFLKEAEKLYADWVKSGKPAPLDFISLFATEDTSATDHYQGLENIEKAHTHTLYYLAQVYEHLNENEKAALYCHSTLKRQYESGSFIHIEWALNCATLSQFYIAKDDFVAGRHHLCCSDWILAEYEKVIHKDMDNLTPEEQENKLERLRHCKADVARCWIKYCTLLLIASRDAILATSDAVQNKPNAEEHPEHVLIKDEAVPELEKQVLARLVVDYEDAKTVFLAGLRWFKEAKDFYTLDGYASDYILVIQDGSKLYSLLSFFEPNSENQCKMHKRRIDMLEETLKALNPQFYLHACRALMFELGEVYSLMMDIKLSLFEDGKKSAAYAAKKINTLGEKGISYFQKFLDTLKTSEKFPKTFTEDVVRPALIAHFLIARLYSKLFVVDPNASLQNLTKSQAYYMFVIDYVKINPDHEKFIKEEIEVIREMVKLLPGKMQNIATSSR